MSEATPAQRVAAYRKAQGLSLREFAALAGVHFSSVKRFEDGKGIRFDIAMKMLAAANLYLVKCSHNWETRCTACGAVRD